MKNKWLKILVIYVLLLSFMEIGLFDKPAKQILVYDLLTYIMTFYAMHYYGEDKKWFIIFLIISIADLSYGIYQYLNYGTLYALVSTIGGGYYIIRATKKAEQELMNYGASRIKKEK